MIGGKSYYKFTLFTIYGPQRFWGVFVRAELNKCTPQAYNILTTFISKKKKKISPLEMKYSGHLQLIGKKNWWALWGSYCFQKIKIFCWSPGFQLLWWLFEEERMKGKEIKWCSIWTNLQSFKQETPNYLGTGT